MREEKFNNVRIFSKVVLEFYRKEKITQLIIFSNVYVSKIDF